jgi:hypothetical protein
MTPRAHEPYRSFGFDVLTIFFFFKIIWYKFRKVCKNVVKVAVCCDNVEQREILACSSFDTNWLASCESHEKNKLLNNQLFLEFVSDVVKPGSARLFLLLLEKLEPKNQQI